MAVRCPVCGEISGDNIAICAMCGFADLNSVFLSQEDYKEWLEHVVKPFSEEYWKQHDKRQEMVDSRNSSESDVKDRENIMSIAVDHDHIVDEKKDETVVSTEINADIKYKYCTGQGDINVQNEPENSYSNNKMLFFDCVITDKDGIHARPASVLVKEAKKYKSRIIIKKGEKEANAARLMETMSLGVKCGETVKVLISGIDEDMAYEAMKKAVFEANLVKANPMLFFAYEITDKDGIHARPAGVLVKEAKKYKSRIIIKKGEKEANAARLMETMSLGVKCGETVKVLISGIDEDMAYEAMKKAFYEANL